MSTCLSPHTQLPAAPSEWTGFQSLFGSGPGPERAAMANVRWPVGSTVQVGFLSRPDAWGQKLRAAVRAVAPIWSQHANITFAFVDGPSPDIGVNFDPAAAEYGTYSSYLGTEAQAVSAAGRPSMHLVFDPSDPDNNDAEFERVILHEFGHALGLIHEHARPDRPILWDQPAVFRYYHKLTGWDWDQIYDQVIAPYDQPILGITPFDSSSIMMYPFPAGLAEYADGSPFESGWNRVLSPADIALVEKMYPFDPPESPRTRGELA